MGCLSSYITRVAPPHSVSEMPGRWREEMGNLGKDGGIQKMPWHERACACRFSRACTVNTVNTVSTQAVQCLGGTTVMSIFFVSYMIIFVAYVTLMIPLQRSAGDEEHCGQS